MTLALAVAVAGLAGGCASVDSSDTAGAALPEWYTQSADAREAQGVPNLRDMPEDGFLPRAESGWTALQTDLESAGAETKQDVRATPVDPTVVDAQAQEFEAAARAEIDATSRRR